MSEHLFIRIRGWDKFQHYKDRNPPWIKLHRELLTSLTWALADDASRVLAIALMLLAAATENKTPANPDYVKRVAYLHQLPDFSQLVQLEFIEIIDVSGKVVSGDSKVLASARPETETETEKRKKKPSPALPERPSAESTSADTLPQDSQHKRIHSMLMNAYKEQNGVECPWDGGEARQLSELIKATTYHGKPWPDTSFAQCLQNMYASKGFPKGKRPREFLPRLPKYHNGPLDEFGNEVSNGKHQGSNASGSKSAGKAAYHGSGSERFAGKKPDLIVP